MYDGVICFVSEHVSENVCEHDKPNLSRDITDRSVAREAHMTMTQSHTNKYVNMRYSISVEVTLRMVGTCESTEQYSALVARNR